MAGALFIVQASAKRRARLFKEAGIALGLQALQPGEHAVLPSTELMRKKRRWLGAALQGEWQGLPVMVFDLFHPASKSISRQTVLAVRHAGAHWPEFALIERDALKYFPSVDIEQAQGAPQELRRRWYSYTRDGEWPFGDALTRWLLPRARTGWFNQRWSYEGDGSRLVVYRRGTLASPKRLKTWLDEALAEAQGLREQISGVGGGEASDDLELGAHSPQSLHVKVSFNVRSRIS